jgi:hypothetical protein
MVWPQSILFWGLSLLFRAMITIMKQISPEDASLLALLADRTKLSKADRQALIADIQSFHAKQIAAALISDAEVGLDASPDVQRVASQLRAWTKTTSTPKKSRPSSARRRASRARRHSA